MPEGFECTKDQANTETYIIGANTHTGKNPAKPGNNPAKQAIISMGGKSDLTSSSTTDVSFSYFNVGIKASYHVCVGQDADKDWPNVQLAIEGLDEENFDALVICGLEDFEDYSPLGEKAKLKILLMDGKVDGDFEDAKSKAEDAGFNLVIAPFTTKAAEGETEATFDKKVKDDFKAWLRLQICQFKVGKC